MQQLVTDISTVPFVDALLARWPRIYGIFGPRRFWGVAVLLSISQLLH